MDINSLGINLGDYQNPALNNQVLAGQGMVDQEQLSELAKALEAQQITGRETANLTTASGAPLKTESLEKTLKLITFKEAEIVLWKKIQKVSAYNTVEEYNQLTSYGAERGGFNLEGELPTEEDSTYVRRSQLVKFMGVVKSVSHPMMLINNMIGNAIDRETKNGSLWILRKANKALAFGNSKYISEEFDGLYAQHMNNDGLYTTLNDYFNSQNVVDLRGAKLKEENIENAAEAIVENHGYGSDLFAPPKVLSDFVKNFYGNKFINPNTEQTSNGIMGQRVQAFDSQFGKIALNYDVFLSKGATKTVGTGATSPNAPASPTSLVITPVAPTVDNSKWTSADAGNYFYGVVGVNRFGEGAFVPFDVSAATIAAGGAVDLAFTHTTGTNAATAYVIYRSEKGAAAYDSGPYYPLFTVSLAEKTAGFDGAVATKIRDNNRWLPNTNQAFLIQNDDECVIFKQLAPLMKMDLALLAPAYRFMVLLYGTPILYAPKKMTRFINIGV